jgi:GTPase SAR1 family protein
MQKMTRTKVVICGPANSGKSQLCSVFFENPNASPENPKDKNKDKTPVQIDTAPSQNTDTKTYQYWKPQKKEEGQRNLQIWEIPSALTLPIKPSIKPSPLINYFANCKCVLLTVDLSDPKGIEKARSYWVPIREQLNFYAKASQSYDSLGGYQHFETLPVVVIGTKSDRQSLDSEELLKKFAAEIKAEKHNLISTKMITPYKAIVFNRIESIAAKFKTSISSTKPEESRKNKNSANNSHTFFSSVESKTTASTNDTANRAMDTELQTPKSIPIIMVFLLAISNWLSNLLSSNNSATNNKSSLSP